MRKEGVTAAMVAIALNDAVLGHAGDRAGWVLTDEMKKRIGGILFPPQMSSELQPLRIDQRKIKHGKCMPDASYFIYILFIILPFSRWHMWGRFRTTPRHAHAATRFLVTCW